MKCELCGSSVKVVGDTTKHYELNPDYKKLTADMVEALIKTRQAIWCENVDEQNDAYELAKQAIAKYKSAMSGDK
jgi:hypothetical protein